MELEMTYVRLAVPDCWNAATAHGPTPAAALEKIMAGVPPLVDADDCRIQRRLDGAPPDVMGALDLALGHPRPGVAPDRGHTARCGLSGCHHVA